MHITIIGTGYVGLVTGACFAEMGNHVTCVDLDESKLALLKQGVVPIHEPGLEEVIARTTQSKRLEFTSQLSECLHQSRVVFIAVGTPPNEDGSADLSHVLNVAKQIGQLIENDKIVVTKSTVPVGTADKVSAAILAELSIRGVDVPFDVVSNPEFLKEGAAVQDFMSPDRIVVGSNSEHAREVMTELYAPFSRNHDKVQFMSPRDAEMTKYAANAMLATKISFMNEIALMCDAYGVDVESVRRGIGSDPRIGFSFIYPGAGYGGSCFPKDVRALIHMAEAKGFEPELFRAVDDRNQRQKTLLVDRMREELGDLSGLKVALWGLAFKPETDDIREAPALAIIAELIDAGAHIKAYDPQAMENAKNLLPQDWQASGDIQFAEDPYAAVEDADVLVVVTEWKEFRQPDFQRLASTLRKRHIFDGRNMYDPARLLDYGLGYTGIGRSSALFSKTD